MLTPRDKRSRMQCLRHSSNKFAVIFILAAVLVSVIATTPPVGAATTHPIQYHIGCPASMVNDGSLDYFKAHGFTAVHLVVPDTGTYRTELNKIKSLGMQPIIDIEVPIWNGGQVTTPISNFASYFQSLKNAGWEYVSSEGGRAGDLDFMSTYFKGYVNYNCDQCGLWGSTWATPPYKHSFTVTNSWESYYTSEWPYIQQGATQAASLGKQNGILAGVWEYGSDGVDYNPILTNSKNGGSPSYKSMLDWSYSNGVGFNHFHVWCGLNSQGLSKYKTLGFEKIVADLQVYYPATSSTPGKTTTTAITASTTNPTIGQSVTFTVNLKSGSTGLSKPVKLWCTVNGGAPIVRGTFNTVNGVYTFSGPFSQKGQVIYHAEFAGDSTYGASSGTVTVNVGAWTNIGGQLLAGTGPAAYSWGTSRTGWFVTGTNHQLYHSWTGRSGWENLGGYLTSSPAAVSSASGVIDVFVRGTTGALYTKHYLGGVWGGWTNLGGVIPEGTGPGASSWAAGRLDVFVKGTDSALYHKFYNGKWSGWENLGGRLTTSPGAVSRQSGVIDVFLKSTTGAVYQKTYNGSWSGWANIGGQVAPGTGPGASGWTGRADLFVQGTNSALYQRTWDASTGWSTSWTSLGGTLTSSPVATSPATGQIAVFVRGTTGALYERVNF